MKKPGTSHQPAAYQITVDGKLGQGWFDALEGITMTFDGEATTLSCPALDQAALRGLLCRLWDMNLVLLATIRMDLLHYEESEAEHEHDDSIL